MNKNTWIMIKHYGIFANRNAIQQALNNGELENPYVAKYGANSLDFNSMVRHVALWEWEGDVLTILEPDAPEWGSAKLIATNVYNEDDGVGYEMNLQYDSGEDAWEITMDDGNYDYYFYPGADNEVNTGIIQDITSIDERGELYIKWNGHDTFTFVDKFQGDEYSSEMTPINP
jgi:hypothetical protein